ncbi:serine--tRNA ligase [Lachnospiraceae bacterium BX10]|uniref:Serine--tRNA ligase n=1 Tax=Enterocloster hominis (ex Liu et al. 2021) TaxID=2763663 RepID=A0ABR7NS87_9FIRM|nr:serine--tRNA ligase [Enterocloster hominis]MBC8598987.1 serine--tRNA ligase [Enterocloster hominis]
MLDLRFVRENPEIVKQNIRNKFQDSKLPLVDEVIALDEENRKVKKEADDLRASRNKISKQIGALMGQGKKEEAEEVKKQVTEASDHLAELEEKEKDLEARIKKIMMTIPNIIDPSVPIGKDDSENVEVQKYGEPVVPDFEIPYHTEIMEKFNGIDLDSARRVAGNGFYYLMGDIARLHSAVISYARDFMIGRGFTYCVPPFMIRSDVVTGVMSFAEMDAMMYKIEGEDLYLIGTSEHSMIGKFIDTIIPEEELPKTLTSYSPCFRKEKGAHGIEERGVYRIHQFEKQEMIVVCHPDESRKWFDVLWQNTVDLFRSLGIPVRTLECCSGDLADLKVKSVDVEAWSPRQKKYFEVGSCSNLGDAQARRLRIRVNGADGKKYFAHTLNNTVVAPPRMLIAFLENNLQADGSVRIPEALQPYMGGMKVIK